MTMTTTTLAAAMQPVSLDSAIEAALVQGDLAKLTTPQRIQYYHATCASLGLNPLTKPFAYISLNGKLVMYPLKDCTDQLRRIHRISLRIVSRERSEDIYVVTARAIMPDGREDEATGAVTLAGLKGELLANALMKAETKAKRRATLSITGLGLTDESEVADIPGAQRVPYDAVTGEIVEARPATVADVPSPFVALLARTLDAPDLAALQTIAKDTVQAFKANMILADEREKIVNALTARKLAIGVPASGPDVAKVAEVAA